MEQRCYRLAALFFSQCLSIVIAEPHPHRAPFLPTEGRYVGARRFALVESNTQSNLDPAGHVSVTFRVVSGFADLGKRASQMGGARETGNARLRRHTGVTRKDMEW